MPLYPFICPEHGEVEIFADMDKSSSARCPVCGMAMKRKYTPFSFTVAFRPGWQPAFGKYVDTSRELNNLVAEKGLVRG